MLRCINHDNDAKTVASAQLMLTIALDQHTMVSGDHTVVFSVHTVECGAYHPTPDGRQLDSDPTHMPSRESLRKQRPQAADSA